MPIVDVEIVAPAPEQLTGEVTSALADAIGQALGTGPADTWVRLRTLAAESYAENGVARTETPRPVFVTVLKGRRPTGDALASEVDQITGAVARILDRRADRVHVLYLADAAGRIAFGGVLVPHSGQH